MVASIDQFKANFTNAGVRPNQFKIQLSFPNSQPNQEAVNLSEFMCTAASIPNSTVGVIETYFRGRAIKHAGDRSFDPWQVTIINDSDFKVRNAIENWSELINTNSGNIGAPGPGTYWADLYVTQLDRAGNELKTYKMLGAFPAEISSIDLNFETVNTIETFTVTFQYQYWSTSGLYGNIGSSVSNILQNEILSRI